MNMEVPANRRKQFDTSAINTGINAVEEAHKHETYSDVKPYIPTPDPRGINVVEKIKDGIPQFDINDDSVSKQEYDRKVSELEEEIAELKEADEEDEGE